MAKQTVALYTVTSGDRVERARTSLAEALGEAKLGDPDETGAFDVSVEAESPEAARELVREAFARAGTGDDFVIRETTEGREMPADDPRQGDAGANGDRATRVADAASAVADAAGTAAGAAREAAGSAADAAREAAASDAAQSARAAAAGAAESVREAVDEKGVAGAASDYASTAAGAARESPLRRFAPIGGLLLLLWVLRRMRR
jgi:hypothetical protein